MEDYFISMFKSKKIGDDGAIADGFVFSKDAFFENVHFKKEWISFYDMAKKSMLVNISDAIAMNAVPKYALLCVAMPSHIKKEESQELFRGFYESATAFGVEIIGGDTISNSKLDISVTIVSKTKKPLLRSGAKNGHLIAYTGELGRSLKELKKLQNLGSTHKNSKFVNLKLRDRFVYKNSHLFSSGMDISDGLFSDLAKISKASRVGFRFYKKIDKKIGCSGEEYEMLISFDKRHKQALKRRSKLARTPLYIFGECARRRYFSMCKSHHF